MSPSFSLSRAPSVLLHILLPPPHIPQVQLSSGPHKASATTCGQGYFELDVPDVYPPDHDGQAPLRMTKGARASTTADGISDAALRETIANPEDIEPDSAGQGRLRLRRGTMVVIVARDGMILSVRDRKGRRRN